mmetsp:Transcript_29108/g.26506  ORF Transcript_29108/g.26506 Transcript_29108/m.26506 type:complete len:855 (+) Transcript_29108:55-2619(+)
MSAENVYRIPPFQYIHVLDNNSNVTRLEVGPATFIRKEHETVVNGPNDMIRLPPRHYCIIKNPVITDEKGVPQKTTFGQVRNKHGDIQVRHHADYTEPFALYPGETLKGKVEKYRIIQQNQAIKLAANRDFIDDNKVPRNSGDEWLLQGPLTYQPRIEEDVVQVISAEVNKPNQAIRLRAKKNCKDANNIPRKTGEEWLIREVGSYLPQIDEEIIEHIKGTVITDRKALKLRALKTFKDVYGIERKAGEEWIIDSKITQLHIKDVHEEVVGEVKATTLNNRQYCVVLDPFDTKTRTNKWGSRQLRKGEVTFFLQPGESLEDGKVKNIEVLTEDEALLLQAIEDVTDAMSKKPRKAGEQWLILGPCEYIPPVEVRIVDRRKKIPLDENEGIYVRNKKTGEVRMETGKTYLLEAHEELWEKELPETVEFLIAQQKVGQPYVPPKFDAKGNLVYESAEVKGYKRDKTRVVTYRAPSNSAVQLYDYKAKESRVVFGPSLVLLGPDEQFTLISLSGGLPKRENVIQSLNLFLGPDFMNDVIDVETSDHARLRIQLSYNWQFRFDKTNKDDYEKIFSIKDFIGDACKSVASRVRGAVSSVTFDDFHKKRKDLIQLAVFGAKPDGSPREELIFKTNNLIITNVDVQNPEPIDPKMKESLFKSQSLNIDITTRTQEMNARHRAQRQAQESQGELEIQKYNDLSRAEEAKKELLLLKADTDAIKAKGEAVSVAKARVESELIEVEAEVKQAELKAEALKIESDAEISARKKEYDAEATHVKALNDLEITKAKEMAEIESKKFTELVSAIGKETIVSMARAGPETQAKLLKGLGLKGFLISDGKNPINLFNTANGILGGMNQSN